ncbi:MAG: type II toxin-antitoxin system VapC family toxin [Verrucomicrobia bacterium]|jgi:tRNA(fMet)-specific endonuclease VapC|nr:type II toxin-antitoxin system VapC family toxin [Verrucomicrobiota bacterium]MBT7068360.1 type II toxin-antitoxin system VapC family toxin [Verrucomicrobiota bacterium]MBT7698937.1 type II toxin-antitoxin system VapC family toxin [Verrucomicrobiota bacterium]
MRAVLLDTNAFTALFQGDLGVLDVVARADTVYASAIVIGELEAGFRGGNRYASNIEVLDRFLAKASVETLPVSRETGECFGRVKQTLKSKGTPIPMNDVWLASQCMETGAILVTFDRHFDVVDGLRLWAQPEKSTPED